MKVLSRLFALFLVVSLLALVGCMGGNDDDGGYSVPLTGEILVSAFADSGSDKTFAALRDNEIAEVRAVVADKFQARVKIDDGVPLLYDLSYASGTDLLELASVVVNSVAPGTHRVTVEIVAKGAAADAPAIMKRISHATVVAGETNITDIKNAEINYDSTAKALVYEAWSQNTTKTIDEMTVDLTKLKKAIQGLIIDANGVINETAALNLQTLDAEIKTALENIKVVEVALTHFTGDYRAFFVNALAAKRWVGVSDVSVVDGKITETVKVNSDSTLVDTESNYTVIESKGDLTFSTVTKNRGAVSASGNVAMVHVWNRTPYVGLFIKKPTAATNATLKGTYRVFEYSDAVDVSYKPSQPVVQAYSLKFDGEGGFTVTSSFNPDTLASTFTAGTYAVATGGKVTFNGASPKNEYTQIDPAGNMFAYISYTAGGRCIFAVGVRQGATAWSGNSVEACVNAGVDSSVYNSYSTGALVSAAGSAYSQSEQRTEYATPDALKTYDYTIDKGGITLTGVDAGTYSAGVDAAGEVYCIVTKSTGTWRNFSVGVMK
ncbi:MAG: hypothetical protein KKB51_13815 [Candidatus Riflebacteria bacterium]|nr:hypothetical protein [Candidatus Riflebacteria bacterium]